LKPTFHTSDTICKPRRKKPKTLSGIETWYHPAITLLSLKPEKT